MLGLTGEGKSCKTVIRPDKAGEGGGRGGFALSLFPPRSALLLHLGGITPKGSEKDTYSPGVSENHDFSASVTLDLPAPVPFIPRVLESR